MLFQVCLLKWGHLEVSVHHSLATPQRHLLAPLPPAKLHAAFPFQRMSSLDGMHLSLDGFVFAAAAAAKSLQSCPTLCDPIDGSPPAAPLSLGFSRQEHWSGLPFPSPGDLPDLGIELSASSALAGRFFITEPRGKLGASFLLVYGL